jgi:hypothetical protein
MFSINKNTSAVTTCWCSLRRVTYDTSQVIKTGCCQQRNKKDRRTAVVLFHRVSDVCHTMSNVFLLNRSLRDNKAYIWLLYVQVCMFRHNYFSVNGIVSFPYFAWLYKYKEEYKQREMWHSAQRVDISEEMCMFQPARCQATGTWLISAETNNEELLIARQRFRNHGYIDGNNCVKKSYRQLQESSRRESTIYPGNAGESASI